VLRNASRFKFTKKFTVFQFFNLSKFKKTIYNKKHECFRVNQNVRPKWKNFPFSSCMNRWNFFQSARVQADSEFIQSAQLQDGARCGHRPLQQARMFFIKTHFEAQQSAKFRKFRVSFENF
jgi:hypothetical protein